MRVSNSSWQLLFMAWFYNQTLKIITPSFSGSSSGSPSLYLPSHQLFDYTAPVLQHSVFPSFSPPLHLCHHCFLLQSFLIPSFLTQCLVTPATHLKTFISISCTLDLSLSFKIHASQPYTKVGTTTVLYTRKLTTLLSSLFSKTGSLSAPTVVAELSCQSSAPVHSPSHHSHSASPLDIPSPLLALSLLPPPPPCILCALR